jgi:hypothetical protein
MSVSSCAREISKMFGVSVRPRDISVLFYQRELRDDLCPIEAGRRVIPESYVAQVAAALRRRGKLGRAAA